MNSFGEKFRECRLARGLTLGQAAFKLGKPTSNICHIEKGSWSPPLNPARLQKMVVAMEFDSSMEEELKFCAFTDKVNRLKILWGIVDGQN